MTQFFTNPWLLIGLAGIGLPILAHLLTRRRYDLVDWAAMQFLNPSKKTRRRVKLEELLLLLVRIGLITLITLSVTRPWLPGGWLSGYYSTRSRTIVLVIDGSNSMSRADGVNSMHQNALRRASDFLRTLGADDSVALIDARDKPRAVIESPLRDLAMVEQEIRRLPPPGGACEILPAVEKAIAIVGRSSSSAREIVVFTDRQGISWKSDSEEQWLRIDDLMKFPAVRPHIWAVDVAPHLGSVTSNISVGRIELSREITVPDFAVRLQVAIRNESRADVQVPLRLLLDGQPLAGEHQNVFVPAHGESIVEFDHALRADGTHVLSVAAEMSDDAIPVDNVSHVAIHVAKSLDVLLINGTPSAQPAERDCFFAELAFSPTEGKPPWVKVRVVEVLDLKPSDFESVSAAMFCNVGTMAPDVALALRDFVAGGNGVFVACGSQTTPESFQTCFGDSGLLPQLQIVRTRDAPPKAEQIVRVAPMSLQPGWLDRFRSVPARSFLKATFDAWCLVKVVQPAIFDDSEAMDGEDKASHKVVPKSEAPDEQNETSSPVSDGSASRSDRSTPQVVAKLSCGDPLLLQSRCGDGIVLVMTTTLNRSWNDLPTRSDYVPFLHEAVFHILSSRSHRNVEFGEPLIAQWDSAAPDVVDAGSLEANASHSTKAAYESIAVDTVTFLSPSGTASGIKITPGVLKASVVFSETFAPGVYMLTKEADAVFTEQSDHFVVNYNHSEDDLTQMTDEDKARLATNDRVRFSSSIEDLAKRMYGQESVAELWALLLAFFLLFLVIELFLTRRAIRTGYGNDAVT
jgi:hypothetical protein